MAVQIQLRRGTAANWTATNPTLAQGELGLETDTGKVKMGDGSTAWTTLGYFGGVPSGAAGGDLTGTFPNPTVAAAAITLAKMANLAANSILGNNTGAAATPIALTATQVKTLLAIATGDVSGLAAIASSGSGADLVAATVALAKMATQANNTILGNNSGGAASPSALTAAQVKTLLAIAQADVSGLGTADSPTHAALTLTNGQIAFPATQVPSAGANTLDDYEEGTFTTVLSYVTPGTSSWSAGTKLGWYTKIGNLVFYTFFVNTVPTNGTASGNLQMTGLPFSAVGTTSEHHQNAVALSGWTKASFTSPTFQILSGGATGVFQVSGSAQSTTTLAVGDIPTGGTVIARGSGFYMTA